MEAELSGGAQSTAKRILLDLYDSFFGRGGAGPGVSSRPPARRAAIDLKYSVFLGA